jgi:hypothetical protein
MRYNNIVSPSVMGGNALPENRLRRWGVGRG